MKTALCLGAGGFIGSHMVKRLREDNYHVTGVDLVLPAFSKTKANASFQVERLAQNAPPYEPSSAHHVPASFLIRHFILLLLKC